ncbi:MAG: glycosyltransferase [Candidatus Angelobacter sp.]
MLIPVYNEEEFISALLNRVLDAPLPDGMDRELIVVDDGSTDRSFEIAQEIANQNPIIRLLRHPKNRGKGAAIRTAVDHATGDFSVIQDSDLELSPNEYPRLLKPLLEGSADVVYGSRFMTVSERRVLNFWHALGNRMLTNICNMFAGINLTDMETCYKTFRTSLLQSIPIRSDRFGIEPELTVKLAQRRARIYEIPISYNSRTYDEGKKIGLSDAIDAVYVIVKTSFVRDIFKDPAAKTLEAFASAPRLNRWLAEKLQPYLGDEIMEVGAGAGAITRSLVAGMRRYTITDNNPEHLDYLSGRFGHRPNVEVRFVDLAQPESFAPFAGEMDSVVCVNVLEYIDSDLSALNNMRSALRPGGRIIVVVPQGMEIFGTLDEGLRRRRRYSQDELRQKLQDSGFDVDELIQFNRASRPGWYFKGKVLKRDSISRRQMRRFDRLVPLWRKLDALLPWAATCLIAIATRRASRVTQ